MAKKQEQDEPLNTIIGTGSQMKGEIKVEGGIRIDGEIVGNILATGTLTVGKNGKVKSDTINCKRAFIAGNVIGNINAPNGVHLESTASVTGEIRTGSLRIDEGATFHGQSLMQEESTTR
ncbi:polymer-forming cytoskeletal protein [bacterium]|nr:polymer-forming cytoskeletal protein [bacterium]